MKIIRSDFAKHLVDQIEPILDAKFIRFLCEARYTHLLDIDGFTVEIETRHQFKNGQHLSNLWMYYSPAAELASKLTLNSLKVSTFHSVPAISFPIERTVDELLDSRRAETLIQLIHDGMISTAADLQKYLTQVFRPAQYSRL